MISAVKICDNAMTTTRAKRDGATEHTVCGDRPDRSRVGVRVAMCGVAISVLMRNMTSHFRHCSGQGMVDRRLDKESSLERNRHSEQQQQQQQEDVCACSVAFETDLHSHLLSDLRSVG
jgi:hypothetical protein